MAGSIFEDLENLNLNINNCMDLMLKKILIKQNDLDTLDMVLNSYESIPNNNADNVMNGRGRLLQHMSRAFSAHSVNELDQDSAPEQDQCIDGQSSLNEDSSFYLSCGMVDTTVLRNLLNQRLNLKKHTQESMLSLCSELRTYLTEISNIENTEPECKRKKYLFMEARIRQLEVTFIV